ncbi:hypothetical protein BT96DRAFT_352147 [Gymnopus androsaceus JB14]|uniref:Uncharacterized protein n=1 Tax=Gymnopus androsaceus JB14 TaxID=1447944 RepID=A0A6A4GWW8_9AGAR|nr:hypothetical protein BT96DRAFT_352147 [Gymnopus androsaceus JB14]
MSSIEVQSFLPWDTFKSELKNAFQHPSSEDIAFDHIRRWNDEVFKPNGIEAILCLEFPLDSELDHDVGTYAVYVMDLAQARADGRQKLVDMFGPLPSHLRKICFVDAIPPSVSRQRGYPLGLTLEREIVVPESPSRTSSIVGPVDKELDIPLPSDDSATKSPIVPAAIPSSPVSPQSQSQSPPPQAGPSRPSQTPRSTDRRVTTVTTTRPDGRNGKRTNSAPQVVANSRSHKTSNTTPPDGRARTRKRTDSSQKVRRK